MPSLTRSTRPASLWGRAAAATIAAALLAGGAAASSAQAAANPYERGPAPTAVALEKAGPFTVQEYAAANTAPGFRAGRIYAPADASKTYGAVAIVPGFVSNWDWMAWIGPRLASHGFVVMGIDTNSPVDLPDSRSKQVLAGLANLLADSRVKARIDPSRTAVAGWSMGGGGALEAAIARPDLKAVVAYAPWDLKKDFSAVKVPALIIGDEWDELAGVNDHAIPFYNTVQAPKAFANLALSDHFYVLFDNIQQSRLSVAWLKRYVDNDTRYTPFLSPGPATNMWNLKEYRYSGVN